MADSTSHTTKTGRILSDTDIGALADEAEQGYDVERGVKFTRPSASPMERQTP
jgi:hypothetical protein